MSGCINFDIKYGRFFCTATTNETCEGKQCKFYKSQEQLREQKEQVRAHLRSLPDDKQAHISEKYYDGKTPWWE